MEYLENETREQFRRVHELFDVMMRTCTDGVWSWDLEDPGAAWVSPQFWSLLGYDDGAAAGVPDGGTGVLHLIHPEDQRRIQNVLSEHLSDPASRYDVTVRFKHGKTGGWIWVRSRGQAMRDATGTPVRVLGVYTDVTALKDAEALLLAVSADAAAARQAAVAGSDRQVALLRALQQELATPLAGISDLTRQLASEPLPRSANAPVSAIAQTIHGLQVRIDEMLEAARVRMASGRLARAPFVPADVVSMAVELVAGSGVPAGVRVALKTTPETEAPMSGCARSLAEAVRLMVAQVARGVSGGTVDVRCDVCALPDGGRKGLSLRVTAPRAAEATRPATDDLGYVRILCERHGGALVVTGGADQAASTPREIVATFEMRPASEVGPSGRAPKPKALPLRLLVLEENGADTGGLRAKLAQVNAELVVTHATDEALEAAAEQRFDAAFVDIRPFEPSNRSFAPTLRAQEVIRGAGRLLLVGVTPDDGTVGQDTFLGAGFDRILAKPVTLNAVRWCVNWIWEQREQAKALVPSEAAWDADPWPHTP